MKLTYESFEQELFFKLPTGNAKSIKSLEFTTELFKLIEVPKAYVGDFRRIYSNIGNSVYVFLSQEAKEVFISSHFLPEDGFEWDVCLIATFSTNKMSRDFAEYLEYLVCTLIKDGGVYSVRNKGSINEPSVSEAIKSTCKAKISFLNILLTALKFDLFLKTEENVQAGKLPVDESKKTELTTAVQAEVKKEQGDSSVNPVSNIASLTNHENLPAPAPINFSYGNKVTYTGSVLKKAVLSNTQQEDDLAVEEKQTEKPKVSRKTGYKRSVFNDLFFICQNEKYNAYAIATYNPYTNEMTVLEGSKFSLVRPDTSLGRYDKKKKIDLIRIGKFADKGDYLELTEDYVFTSPSTASSIVLNHTSNGKGYWRTSRDCKLGDYINNLVDEEEDDSVYKPSHLGNLTTNEPSKTDDDKTNPSVFFCQYDSKNVFAEGIYDPVTKKITVKKGSTFSLNMISSLIGGQAEREKKKMIREGILILDDNCYTLTEDYTFRIVSRASEVVIGSGYGRKAWVNKNGQDINEYYQNH